MTGMMLVTESRLIVVTSILLEGMSLGGWSLSLSESVLLLFVILKMSVDIHFSLFDYFLCLLPAAASRKDRFFLCKVSLSCSMISLRLFLSSDLKSMLLNSLASLVLTVAQFMYPVGRSLILTWS